MGRLVGEPARHSHATLTGDKRRESGHLFSEHREHFPIGFADEHSIFRMPLHGEYKCLTGFFQRLNDAIARNGRDDQAFSRPVDCLMVP